MRQLVMMLAALGVCACGTPKPAAYTEAELVADPVLLQGIVARCAADKRAAAHEVECKNARLAVERLAADEDAKRAGERGAEFERQREQRRAEEERSRREADRAGSGFDPYSSPVANGSPSASTQP